MSWSYNLTPALFCFLLQDFEARRYIDQKVEVVVSQEYLACKIISQDSQLFFSSFFLCLLLIRFPSHQQSGTTTNEYLTKLDEALKVCIYYHIAVVYDHFCFWSLPFSSSPDPAASIQVNWKVKNLNVPSWGLIGQSSILTCFELLSFFQSFIPSHFVSLWDFKFAVSFFTILDSDAHYAWMEYILSLFMEHLRPLFLILPKSGMTGINILLCISNDSNIIFIQVHCPHYLSLLVNDILEIFFYK